MILGRKSKEQLLEINSHKKVFHMFSMFNLGAGGGNALFIFDLSMCC